MKLKSSNTCFANPKIKCLGNPHVQSLSRLFPFQNHFLLSPTFSLCQCHNIIPIISLYPTQPNPTPLLSLPQLQHATYCCLQSPVHQKFTGRMPSGLCSANSSIFLLLILRFYVLSPGFLLPHPLRYKLEVGSAGGEGKGKDWERTGLEEGMGGW